jgi:hypothetical protein
MGTTKVHVHLIRRKKIHNKKHGYWIFIGTVIMDSEATQYATLILIGWHAKFINKITIHLLY